MTTRKRAWILKTGPVGSVTEKVRGTLDSWGIETMLLEPSQIESARPAPSKIVINAMSMSGEELLGIIAQVRDLDTSSHILVISNDTRVAALAPRKKFDCLRLPNDLNWDRDFHDMIRA